MSKSGMKFVTLGVALAIALGLASGLWIGRAQAASPLHGMMAHDSMGMAYFHPPTQPAKIVRDNGANCDTFSYALVHGSYKRVHHPCRFGNETVDYSPSYRSLFDFRSTATEETATVAEPAVEGTAAAEEPVVEEPAVEGTAAVEAPAAVEPAAEETTAVEEPAAVEPAAEETAAVEEPAAAEPAAEEPAAAEAVPAEEPAAAEPVAEAPVADIVDTALAAGDFTTLVAALEAAGLVDTLKGEGPFTVFAPTDAAFAALPDGTLDDLMADAEDALTQVLLYHVVSGRISAAQMLDGMQEATVQGGLVTFTLDGETVRVDGATIVASDIEASNGVIHVIDAVLAPPAQ